MRIAVLLCSPACPHHPHITFNVGFSPPVMPSAEAPQPDSARITDPAPPRCKRPYVYYIRAAVGWLRMGDGGARLDGYTRGHTAAHSFAVGYRRFLQKFG